MPQCVTCRTNHPSNCAGKLFIDAQIKCNICLETRPSNENWILPCGHSNCKECLTNLGFTEKRIEVLPQQNNVTPPPRVNHNINNVNTVRIVGGGRVPMINNIPTIDNIPVQIIPTNQVTIINNNTEIPPTIRCPVNGNLHRFQFDEATSSYLNDYQSYRCTHCNIVKGEWDNIYNETQTIIRRRIENQQNNCHHEWRRTGGNYAIDLNFYKCRLCDAHQTT